MESFFTGKSKFSITQLAKFSSYGNVNVDVPDATILKCSQRKSQKVVNFWRSQLKRLQSYLTSRKTPRRTEYGYESPWLDLLQRHSLDLEDPLQCLHGMSYLAPRFRLGKTEKQIQQQVVGAVARAQGHRMTSLTRRPIVRDALICVKT